MSAKLAASATRFRFMPVFCDVSANLSIGLFCVDTGGDLERTVYPNFDVEKGNGCANLSQILGG